MVINDVSMRDQNSSLYHILQIIFNRFLYVNILNVKETLYI